MDDTLKRTEAVVAANPKLAALTVQEMAGELPLMRGDESFARLRPHQGPEDWPLDYCSNRGCESVAALSAGWRSASIFGRGRSSQLKEVIGQRMSFDTAAQGKLARAHP